MKTPPSFRLAGLSFYVLALEGNLTILPVDVQVINAAVTQNNEIQEPAVKVHVVLLILAFKVASDNSLRMVIVRGNLVIYLKVSSYRHLAVRKTLFKLCLMCGKYIKYELNILGVHHDW